MIKMNSIERDILTEILNICLAKAADSFAKISREDVLIKVPDILLIQEPSGLQDLFNRDDIEVLVQSEIKGDIHGQTLLLFSSHQVEALKNILIDPLDPMDQKLKNSLLLEISNILTGTLVTYMANILKLNMYGSVPNTPITRKEISPDQLIIDVDISRPILVTINTLFIESKSKINLPLMLIFDVDNLNKVLDIIRKMNGDNKILIKK